MTKFYAALYDNPKTFRREYWGTMGMTYSVCAFVILGGRVPAEFAEDWKVRFEPGQIQGDPTLVKNK